MARSIIREDGKVTYRTTLFRSLAQAQGFARCLQANSRFQGVLIHESAKSKLPAWFVTFLPTSALRQDEIFMAQFDQRMIAGRTEGMEYIFWADPDCINDWWCFHPLSGETYEVSLFECSCPDYQYRCRKAGLLCKHQQAWSAQKAAGTLGKTDKQSRPTPESRGLRTDLDF